jgi:hypothetical protein
MVLPELSSSAFYRDNLTLVNPDNLLQAARALFVMPLLHPHLPGAPRLAYGPLSTAFGSRFSTMPEQNAAGVSGANDFSAASQTVGAGVQRDHKQKRRSQQGDGPGRLLRPPASAGRFFRLFFHGVSVTGKAQNICRKNAAFTAGN